LSLIEHKIPKVLIHIKKTKKLLFNAGPLESDYSEGEKEEKDLYGNSKNNSTYIIKRNEPTKVSNDNLNKYSNFSN
jgi:hypothetical protein